MSTGMREIKIKSEYDDELMSVKVVDIRTKLNMVLDQDFIKEFLEIGILDSKGGRYDLIFTAVRQERMKELLVKEKVFDAMSEAFEKSKSRLWAENKE